MQFMVMGSRPAQKLHARLDHAPDTNGVKLTTIKNIRPPVYVSG